MRFLLDQNFPAAPFDPSTLDRSVEYVRLLAFDADLARVSTPDWLLYLRAAEAGLDGVVTRDRSQLDQPEELLVLARARLSVVTWRQPIEDPVQEWGQLLAYMPSVVRLLDRHGPGAVLLPRPSLDRHSHHKGQHLLGQHAAAQRRAFQEVRQEARQQILDGLADRGLDRLQPLVEAPDATR